MLVPDKIIVHLQLVIAVPGLNSQSQDPGLRNL